ncbi:MAG: carbohydrate kinase family protein [Candidatus Enteromonas sp.]|nr:carbohydrate kinase family protein [Candidatus Enteromonas sp.]
MKHTAIAFAGSAIVDRIYSISAYPKEGELTQIRSVEFAVGGAVCNGAIDLKKMAPSLSVYAFGRIGKDEEGEFLVRVLTQNGVDASYLTQGNGKTSFTDVYSIPQGQRTFFAYPGECANFGIDDIPWDGPNFTLLHLGYFLLLDRVDRGDGLRILQKAKEKGIETSIDLVSENSDRYGILIPCLPYVDYLIINEVEAGRLTDMEVNAQNAEEALRRLLAFGVKKKVMIHAPKFGACLSNQGYTIVPSLDIPPSDIAGSTGAGDAFAASALLMIAQEKSDREILEFASEAAAMALRVEDATSGLTAQDKIREIASIYPRRKLC